MNTAAPTHLGFDRLVLAAALLGRVFQAIRRSLAIKQPRRAG
jgi:hypothetical protein